MAKSKRRSGTSSIYMEVEGQADIQRALRVLAEPEAPFLSAALGESGVLLRDAARTRTHPSIAAKLDFVGVKGKAGALRALVQTKHPGSRSREFGRVWYWTAYHGHKPKTGGGHKEKVSKGQKAQPYMGIIKGDGAIGAVKEEVQQKLSTAFEKEWDRITSGGEA